MTKIEEVAKEYTHYREFHHKCATWFIQIMGFFIAGVLAARIDTPDETKRTIGVLILLAICLMVGVFFYFMFHYPGRIKMLRDWVEGVRETPNNWRAQARAAKISYEGKGDKFFLCILVSMSILAASLVYVRLL